MRGERVCDVRAWWRVITDIPQTALVAPERLLLRRCSVNRFAQLPTNPGADLSSSTIWPRFTPVPSSSTAPPASPEVSRLFVRDPFARLLNFLARHRNPPSPSFCTTPFDPDPSPSSVHFPFSHPSPH